MTQQYKVAFNSVYSSSPLYTGGQVSVSKDQQYIFLQCGTDLNIVRIATNDLVCKISVNDRILGHCVREDTKQVAVSTQNSLVHLIDISDMSNPIETKNWKAHNSVSISLAYDPSGTFLATGSVDRTIRVWDLRKHFITHNFTGHTSVVTKIQFYPSTKKQFILISTSEDYTIKFWDLKTKSCLATIDNHVNSVTNWTFSKNKKFMFAGGRDRVVSKIQIVPTIELIETIPVYDVISTIMVYNKNKILVAGENGVMSVWSTKYHEKEKQSIVKTTIIEEIVNKKSAKEEEEEEDDDDDDEKEDEEGSLKGQIVTNGFLLDSTNEILLITENLDIALFDFKTLKFKRALVGFNDEIGDVKFISKELYGLVSNCEHLRLCYYQGKQKGETITLSGHKSIILSIAVNVNDNLIATAGKDREIRVWNIADLQKPFCQAVLIGHSEEISALSFVNAVPKKNEKKTQLLISGSNDKTIKIWSVTKGQPLITFKAHEKEINQITVAPNKKIFASASRDKTIKLWNVKDGSLIETYRGHRRGVWDVAFSPIDKVFASCSGDQTIKVWSLESNQCIRTLEGHMAAVLRVKFISNGTQIVSTGADSLIKVWNLKSGDCAITIDAKNERVWGIDVSLDENYLISAGSDSNVMIWEDRSEIVKDKMEKNRQQKILKETEYNNYVREKDYLKALKLAFSLDYSLNIFNLIQEICQSSHQNPDLLPQIITKLDEKEIKKCLEYITDWNTNSKRAQISHTLLKNIFLRWTPNQLSQINGIGKIVQSILPYSERHYKRVEKLYQRSFLIEHILSSVKVTNIENVKFQNKQKNNERKRKKIDNDPIQKSPQNVNKKKRKNKNSDKKNLKKKTKNMNKKKKK
ncbi:transducin beta-like protein [Anaeramoeba flamelloides]|uniref:Transducin beta-like protein n=1 Tax=Anaeramoeba flamelloides TaxID=1746091 RepID=A0ABQ8XZH4_9EUKA|nr:transducin beta-like protein [Anaeramoeba flamelloides]